MLRSSFRTINSRSSASHGTKILSRGVNFTLRNSCRPPRALWCSFSSSSPPPHEDDIKAAGLERNDASNTENRPHKNASFPWRHDSAPIVRVAEGNDLSGFPNTLKGRFFRRMLVAHEMELPWFQRLVTRSWEQDLADNFVWAFRTGLAGLLSNAFKGELGCVSMKCYMLRF